MHKQSYAKFGLMILVSTLVMFALMYFNIFQLNHIFFSETRAYMAVMMGAAMAFIMMGFMWKMYANRKVNALILVCSAAVFGVSLWLVRSQATVDDVAWMKAMIPHHSIAVLTSERAHLSDPRVQDLANRIIEAQLREIDEMKGLIRSIESGS
ncbi:DUF305 domain-containing protein [Saccharibacillus alkalitolerans]|uniref:DUF305 domain-containing protein n=1 Tax=Saccharibacillus alkalitolerans TaxID=2705290 RepID=A0ABX0F6P4_9BACL|nr:DUF305 domain-containing protein [Saccharibacillus alkalitolerans]NGZ76442.1 DUF305 domain-containing protein [Saccharibacillus alkalitolerans]